ncbi:50S ribosomal protein L1 [Blattabacterium cuenoti]|uniref:50S ribosomal protein L1 n=1 Tax=Blattabacterium cuenoti TaxID=1653831 RepID=UPI00163D37A6|nr:50S ribosomal protein L1 [Blattabacterium cuenoti]
MSKKITKNRKKILSNLSNLKEKYPLKKCLSILKKISFTKFDESIDISINLSMSTKNQNQSIKGIVKLPNGNGKKHCILSLVSKDKESISQELGANYIGLNFIEKIKNGWWDDAINFVISMPTVMKELTPISKFLGVKGLMPNPKVGTMSDNPEKCIKDIKSGKLVFKVDRYGVINFPIGKVSFSEKYLYENIIIFVKEVTRLNPSFFKRSKYININSIYLSTTMSCSVQLDLKKLFYEDK